jgi:hypothetical protein
LIALCHCFRTAHANEIRRTDPLVQVNFARVIDLDIGASKSDICAARRAAIVGSSVFRDDLLTSLAVADATGGAKDCGSFDLSNPFPPLFAESGTDIGMILTHQIARAARHPRELTSAPERVR